MARSIRASIAAPLRRGRVRAVAAAFIMALLAPATAGAAAPEVPTVDRSGLPALGDAWREENPYRGNTQAVEVGRSVYAQACARCHGKEAIEMGPAANLRLVGLYCRRLTDPERLQRCTRDADHYFLQTVLEGKVRLGVEHMPPWTGILSQEAIWAVRSFIEAQREAKR